MKTRNPRQYEEGTTPSLSGRVDEPPGRRQLGRAPDDDRAARHTAGEGVHELSTAARVGVRKRAATPAACTIAELAGPERATRRARTRNSPGTNAQLAHS